MHERSSSVTIVMVALLIGIFMENLDHTILATAIPTIVSKLGGMDIFSWVFAVYLLTSTIFIPIFGKLADLYGKKPFLLIGFITFVVASVLSANAESMVELIIYRAIQGTGAAPLMPIAFSMIFELVKQEKQGHMQGIFAIVNGLSMIVGPLIGAYLTDNFSWQWVFWINVPLGITALLLIVFFYKEKKEKKDVAIDYSGSVVLLLAITPLMLGLVLGGTYLPWNSWQIYTLFVISFIFIAVFVQLQRKAKEPIIDLHLFNRKVTSSTSISFFQGIIFIGVMTYIPIFIQGVLGGTATQVGYLVTPMIIALMAGAGLGGHLMQEFAPRYIFFGSITIIAISSYLLIQIDIQSSNLFVGISLALMGFGMGPITPLSTLLAQNAVGKENTTSVTSLVTFFRNIGMMLGSSLLAVIVNHQLNSSISSLVRNNSFSGEELDALKDPNLMLDSSLQVSLSTQVMRVLKDSLTIGINQVFIACLAVSIIMFFLSYLAGKERLIPSSEKKIGFH